MGVVVQLIKHTFDASMWLALGHVCTHTRAQTSYYVDTSLYTTRKRVLYKCVWLVHRFSLLVFACTAASIDSAADVPYSVP